MFVGDCCLSTLLHTGTQGTLQAGKRRKGRRGSTKSGRGSAYCTTAAAKLFSYLLLPLLC